MGVEMSGIRGTSDGGDTVRADPAVRDALARASYAYDRTLLEYEDALVTQDQTRRTFASARLAEATRDLAAAQAALAAARVAPEHTRDARASKDREGRLTFDELLSDPTQQLDSTSAVLESILRYQIAPQATASAAGNWVPQAPSEVRTAEYVRQRLGASTAASTAGRPARYARHGHFTPGRQAAAG
ncbi:hypothetical protein [Nocardioides alpinus]|jgi:uncharacterized protein YfiM (DUF2279 family)|uniref:Uncharacterized protein n=2 Tax=Nocardioides alpinus TaxID=748909 RepID=A0ABX4QRG1_9ACTN|nr:hypothetical protein [Nocardioides alpinus]PKH37234.1 hypothetical protein CXG46_17290 [Nocardioides alpinus]